MRGRNALLVAICGGLLAMPAASRAADGELYHWTDEQGVVRYTPDLDRVPRSARGTVEVVEPTAPAAETNGSPVAPGALPAVMGSKLPGELLGSSRDAAPADPAELARRIEELREAIARDRKTLEQLVGAGEGQGDGQDPRLQVIANRLPVMQAELARLEEIQRERAEPPDATQP